jgi:FtsP/CotA-like multicopper oxidase with cupredoxin domain
MDASSMTSVRVGTYQHWRVVNQSAELHPFHIHQVHFLAYAENDIPLANPAWLDTVNIPVGGTVDVILDMTDPGLDRPNHQAWVGSWVGKFGSVPLSPLE